MSDAATIREARRRRILENSQNRLQKITGRVCENSQENEFSAETIGAFSGGSLNADTLNSRLNPSLDGDFGSLDNNLRAPVPLRKSSILLKLFFGTVSYTLLGFLVNIMFLLNLDHLFGKNIMTPFFAMVVAHLLFDGSWSKPEESNIFFAVLLLYNFKPKFINRLKKVIIVCKIILEGFSSYMFSFIMNRWALSFIWTELDIYPRDSSSIPNITNEDSWPYT